MRLLVTPAHYVEVLDNATKVVERSFELQIPKIDAILNIFIPQVLFQIKSTIQSSTIQSNSALENNITNLDGKKSYLIGKFEKLRKLNIKAFQIHSTGNTGFLQTNPSNIAKHLFLLESRRFGKLLLTLLLEVNALFSSKGLTKKPQDQFFTHETFGKQ